MKQRNLTVTLDKAREWYSSGNETLKELALQAFSENELNFDFRSIKSLRDACEALDLDYKDVVKKADCIELYSKASASIFKLNIVKKALNLGQELSFIKNPKNSYICYPFNPTINRDSTYYSAEIKAGKMKIVGKFKVEEEIYLIIGNSAITSLTCFSGLSAFDPKNGSGLTFPNIGFLGCASIEIAEHFSKYFGTLITEAKYGDLKGFEIIQIF